MSSGYPFKRSELFAYDGVIFGNIEADFFTREQLELTNDFIATRGGGLLVMGARSFESPGAGGHAARTGVADRPDRSPLEYRARVRGGVDRGAEHAGPDDRRRVAPGDAARGRRR